jgi:ABC-type transporter Mla subunit MlaD
LSGLLTRLPDGSAGCLLEPADCLSTGLAQPLADAAERLPGCAAELADRSAWSERLPRRIGQPAEGLARRASGLHSLLCRLPDVVQGLAHGAARAECLLADVADAPDRVVDRLYEALQDLGVAVEGRQRPVEDVVQILQPHL